MRESTVKLRHWLVSVLAPKLFEDWSIRCGEDKPTFRRPMINFLKEYFVSQPLVGCEVGVREGINALRIFQNLNVKKLYLVDPYLPYDEPLIPEASTEQYHTRMKREAELRLSNYSDRIVWIDEKSDVAFKSISDKLDFCYIDAMHTYEDVKRDIENFGSLLCSGGVVGGHDFNQAYFGLCRAILDSSLSSKWLPLKGAVYDWWLIKK